MSRLLPASGLTLIELFVALTLAAILATLAVPGFRSQIASAQLSAATNDLLGAMMLARSQAIRLGQRVTICRSSDQQACDTDGAEGWEAGWIIFIDTVRDLATPSIDPGDTVLSRGAPLGGNVLARGNQLVSNYVSFAANGIGRTLAGNGLFAGTIRVCSLSAGLANTRRARDLVLSAQGRFVTRPTPAAVDATCPAP